jgi:hypothetical protein
MANSRIPILTGNVIPSNVAIEEAFSAVIATVMVKQSSTSVMDALTAKFTGHRDATNEELFNALAALCPPEATVMLGLQITGAIHQFSNGAFLVLTGVATPVLLSSSHRHS